MTLRRAPPRAAGFNREQLQELIAKGDPVVLRVDEVLGEDAVRGALLVKSLGRAADEQIVLQDAFDGLRARSLRAAIQGTNFVAPLAPADVVTFESAFELDGKLRSGTLSGRSHGKMPGDVQVISAMVRPNDAVVNEKGAFQSLTIASGEEARSARSIEKVLEVLDWAREQTWPGGAAGVIMRDSGRRTKEFFEEGDLKKRALEEDIEEEFKRQGHLLEVIPAWKVRMGFEQVARDVDPTKTTKQAFAGPFSRRFSLGNGYKGFVRCIVILADEDERAFGGRTGNIIRVAAGVQPITKLPPIAREILEARTRTTEKPADGILKLYDDETVRLMTEERAERYPRQERQPAVSNYRGRGGASNYSSDDEEDRHEYRPRSPSPGIGGLRGSSRPGSRRF
jgi:hypothetical protein